MGDFILEEVMAIVFLDLDGTILDQGKPAKDVLLAISKLKERGHIPVIATGRTQIGRASCRERV